MFTSVKAEISCGCPSSKTWKSSLFSVRDELALRVEDSGVDFDVVDFDLEGDRGLVVPGAASPTGRGWRRACRSRGGLLCRGTSGNERSEQLRRPRTSEDWT